MQSFFIRLLVVSIFISNVVEASLAEGASLADTNNVKAFKEGTRGLLFTMSGSNTIGAALAPAWAQAYIEEKGAKNTQIKPLVAPNEYVVVGELGPSQVYIRVNAHGSSTGFKGLADERADLAMASRAIKNKELKTLAHLGKLNSAGSEHVVALDGLAIITHPGNPVSQLSLPQLGKIFAGEISNWKALGGENAPINLYSRDRASGTWDTFKSLVFGKRYSLHKSAQLFESNDELSSRVSQDRNGIGYVGLASTNQAKPLAVLVENAMPLKPEILHVLTEDYLLTRRLYLYHSQYVTNPYVKEFVRFVQTSRGQEIVEQVGYISQVPVGVVQHVEQGPEFYKGLSRYAKRLSVNFRFNASSAELDNKAKRDVERLASYLKLPENNGVVVQLVGFSDLEKTDRRADILSRLRANAVKVELFNHGIATPPVEGLGYRLPVADSQSVLRTKNDRVEVWVFNDIKKQDSAVKAI